MLGYSFDWSRLFLTHDATIYQSTQWLFLKLLELGVVYRATGPVDWCDSCQTTLASLQIRDGRCWHCNGSVRTRSMPQWYLRVQAYAQENNDRLTELTGWNKLARSAQRHATGEVSGVELTARGDNGGSLVVFTPHVEAIGSATLVILSVNHPDIKSWIQKPGVEAAVSNLHAVDWRHVEREAETLPAVDTGWRVCLDDGPLTLPVVVSPVVDARYGACAVLGIPAIDRVDAAVAQRLGLPSDPLLTTSVSADMLTSTVRYSTRDFPISRQRIWGTPIPLVNCESCGPVAVPFEDLPVRLPEPDDANPAGAPADHLRFQACKCPRCGAEATRDTDTLDCHFDGLWFWMAPCVPPEQRMPQLFEHEELGRWLPVTDVVWGSDGGRYMYDIRMLTKALRDIGCVTSMEGEPFTRVLMHEMIRFDGRKMSKHLGNTIEPEALVRSAGADAVRLAVLYAAAPTTAFTWDEQLLQHMRGLLDRLWLLGQIYLNKSDIGDGVSTIDSSDHLRRRLAVWCEAAIRRITEDLERVEPHKAVRNLMHLLGRLEEFEARVLKIRNEMNIKDCRAMVAALILLVRLSAPLMPHIAEDLWAQAGNDELLATQPWPTGVPQPAK